MVQYQGSNIRIDQLNRRNMKIATFNINNVNKRLDNLLDWLRTSRPEIVCLQELPTPRRILLLSKK